MSKTLLNRRLPTLTNTTPLVGGAFDEETLLKGRAVRRILAEMVVVVTITTVGPAAYHEDAPFSYLRNWELLQEGKTVLTRINGASQRLLRRVEGNVDPAFTLPTIAVGVNTIRADVEP